MVYGGVETKALNLLRRLPSDSIQSNVYYIGESLNGRRDEFEDAAAKFVHCPYIPHKRVDFIRRLSKAFRHDSINKVLSYCFGNHTWISMAARLAGIRHSYVSVCGSPLRGTKDRYKNMALAQIARPFCRVEVALSWQIRDELIRGLHLPEDRIRVIENGCDVDEINRRARRARNSRTNNSVPIISMIARMDDAKDQGTLIRACAKLIGSGFPVRLRLIGDGPMRAEYERLCRELVIDNAVEFLGARIDVPELLGESDVAVLATHTEGFGIVLAEAMCAETAIVATDIPACREVLDSGRCGLLVPSRDVDALAAAITRLLENESLRNQLTREGFQRAAELYNINQLIDKYAALLLDKSMELEKS